MSITLLFCEVLCLAQEKDTLLGYFENLNDRGEYSVLLDIHKNLGKKNSHEAPADYFYEVGTAFEGLNKEDSAFHYYKLAKDQYLTEKRFRNVAMINLEISSLLESQNNLGANPTYFEEFWEYANTNSDTSLLANGYNYQGRIEFLNEDPNVPLENFKKAHLFFEKLGDLKQSITNLMNVGVVFSGRLKDQDSARLYYKKGLKMLEDKKNDLEYSNLYHDLLNNLGNSLRRSKKYQEALNHYHEAETLNIKKYHAKTKKILFGNMDLAYYYLGDYKNAYKYLYKYDSIKDEISLANQNAAISDIQEKYDNQKLRADNLEIEAKRVRNRNWLIAAALALFLGSGIAILLQKNTNKKKLLAEKEVLLKQQKVENLLKEQELLGIDAMIAGQEKERQRLANDLHDNLGSLLASLKMHFQSLKQGLSDQEEQEISKKTEALMEEAYQIVRSIAHVRNAGLKANEGLLPAVHRFAKKVSILDKLAVNVEEHGMTERLENSLEITLFRIIQELVTNVAKHANASECTVHLTNHNHTLNIMVEDNGKGFKNKEIAKKEGMGLYSIQKRVENLDGQVTIEAIPNKGTSIIIDIPLA